MADLLPHLDADRCVHSRIAQARCRACVDACPTGAWVIDDERLGIDPGRCDGCDLCVPACPTGALVPRFHPAVRRTRHGALAFAACHYAGLADLPDLADPADIAGRDLSLAVCLNALGILDLLSLVRAGVGQLLIAAGDCSRCPRGQGEGLVQRLAAVNHLLATRSLPLLAHQALGAEAWASASRAAADPDNRPTLDRRAFFRSAVAAPLRRVNEALDQAQKREHRPGRLLPPARPGDLVPLAPDLDALLCSGCDACLRICPQDVIQLDRREGRAQAYVITAENCNGCGLCVDVCPTRAIRIQHWAPLPQPRLPLIEQRCRSCGVTFHLPQGKIPANPHEAAGHSSDNESHSRDFHANCHEGAATPPKMQDSVGAFHAKDRRASAPSRCPICFQVDHQRQLYQVLA